MALVKYNNNSISSVTALGSLPAGALNLLATNTISSGVSSSSFTSSINSTYDTYLFKFINIHPATNAAKFTLIGSTDGGSNYGVATSTTMFEALIDESGSNSTVRYEDGDDVAQSSSAFPISTGIGSDNDECFSGQMFLFSPSNTTFVKHFMTTIQSVNGSGTPYCVSNRTSGYFNTTSAITAVQFSFSSGNIDSGIIKMYGLSKS
tara:strand:- start:40 stop:657 length:618 start_codon:yes stop_codon:yes gene_type:complete